MSKIPQKQHTIPAYVLPNASEDLFVDLLLLLPTTTIPECNAFFRFYRKSNAFHEQKRPPPPHREKTGRCGFVKMTSIKTGRYGFVKITSMICQEKKLGR